VIPIPDPPQLEGNTFVGWVGLPANGIMGSSNLKIYARHDRNEHTVSYYVDGELVATETLFYGDKLLRRVYPYKPGYVFSGWSYPNLYYMPDRDLTITGTFTKGKYVIFSLLVLIILTPKFSLSFQNLLGGNTDFKPLYRLISTL
jgi:hypothetical protein